MNQSMNKTGANLSWLRTRLSITLGELASILNEVPETIELWESGNTEPGKESFQRLCDFFELDKSVFLLLELEQTDLFTLKKEVAVQKKLVAFKRQEALANKRQEASPNRNSRTDTYH